MTDGKPDGEPRLVKGDVNVRPRGLTRSGAVYFSTTVSMQDIYVASVDLGSGKLLKPPARIAGQTVGFNLGAEWSPDGQSLAYLPRKDASVLAILSIAGRRLEQIDSDSPGRTEDCHRNNGARGRSLGDGEPSGAGARQPVVPNSAQN